MSFKYTLNDVKAVAPQKTNERDVGYDLHLISKIKKDGMTDFYDTGVSVSPCPGYYFELVARSSISKTGYILANSIGIIDPDYTGNIIAALIKINPNKPDLVLPNRLVQIIPRHALYPTPMLVAKLDDTERGSGGFGSTNKVKVKLDN